MPDVIKVDVEANTSKMVPQIVGAIKSAQNAINSMGGVNFGGNAQGLKNFSSSLGNISRDASQFNKSLEASTARVLAFSSSVGIIYTVSRAFREVVSTAIDVQKELIGINSVLKLNDTQLQSFSATIFNIARNTGASFNEVAEAAKELGRQNLGAAETGKRLNDAMLLVRLGGGSAKEAVEGLTATLNSFQKSALTSSEVVNKFAAIGSHFAVTEDELADAIKRVGSSAEDVGVDFDHLIALITSLRQTTQRDASTIGNALRSIFTRLERSDTVEQLEALGVAMHNLDGSARSADEVLKSLGEVYGNLNEKQKAYVTNLTAGLFQANQLKAILRDLNKEYSFYSAALQTSTNATDEAIQRNNTLNQSIAARINILKNSALETAAKYGEIAIKPVVDLAESQFGGKGQSSGIIGAVLGNKIGESIAQGIGDALAGPAGIAAVGIIINLVKKTASYAIEASKSVIGLAKGEQERKQIAIDLQNILKGEEISYQTLVSEAKSLEEVEARILAIAKEKAALSNISSAVFGGAAGRAISEHGASYTNGGLKIRAYADPLREAIQRERASGVPSSSIYVDTDPRLVSSVNPKGLMVANSIDEPLGGWQGVDREVARGGGKIPNFAEFDKLSKLNAPGPGFEGYLASVYSGHETESIGGDEAKNLRSMFRALRQEGTKSIEEFAALNQKIKEYVEQIGLTETSQAEVAAKTAKIGTILGQNVEQEEKRRASLSPAERAIEDFDPNKQIFRGGVNSLGERLPSENIATAQEVVGAPLSPEGQALRVKLQREADELEANFNESALGRKLYGGGIGDSSTKISTILAERSAGVSGIFKGIGKGDLNAVLKGLGKKSLSSDEEKIFQSLKAQAQRERGAARSQYALTASILGSIAEPLVSQNFGLNPGIGQSVQGGLTGLSLASLLPGAAGGPIGLGVAAAGGAAYGAASYVADSPQRKLEELSKTFSNLKTTVDQNVQSIGNYAQVQQKLNDIISTGDAKESDIEQLNSQLTDLFSTITDEGTKRKILDAAGNVDKINAALGEYSKIQLQGISKASVGVLAQTAITNSGATGIAQYFRTNVLKNEDLDKVSGAISRSKQFSSKDLDDLSSSFDKLGKSYSDAGLNEVFDKLGFDLKDLVGRGQGGGLYVLQKAIENISESLKSDEINKATKDYSTAIAQFNHQYTELSFALSAQIKRQNYVAAGGSQIALAQARGAFESSSFGLTESAIKQGQTGLEQAGLSVESQAKFNDINDTLRDKLVEFADKNLIIGAKKDFLRQVNAPGANLIDIAKGINPNDTSKFSDEDANKVREEINKLKINLNDELSKLNTDFKVKSAEITIGSDAEQKLLREKGLAQLLGPAAALGKPIDLSSVSQLPGSELLRTQGEYLLSHNLGPLSHQQIGNIRNKTLQYGINEVTQREELAKLLGPIAGGALATPENLNRATKVYGEQEQRDLAKLGREQLRSLFATDNRLEGKFGGNLPPDVKFALGSITGKSLSYQEGEKIDFGLLLKTAKDFIPKNTTNTSELELLKTLQTLVDVQRLIPESAAAKAAEGLPSSQYTLEKSTQDIIKGFNSGELATSISKLEEDLRGSQKIAENRFDMVGRSAEYEKEKSGLSSRRDSLQTDINRITSAKQEYINNLYIPKGTIRNPYSGGEGNDPVATFENSLVKIGLNRSQIDNGLGKNSLYRYQQDLYQGGSVEDIYAKFQQEPDYQTYSRLVGGEKNVKKSIVDVAGIKADTSKFDNSINDIKKQQNETQKQIDQLNKAIIDVNKLLKDVGDATLGVTQNIKGSVKVVWDDLVLKAENIPGITSVIQLAIKEYLGGLSGLPKAPAPAKNYMGVNYN